MRRNYLPFFMLLLVTGSCSDDHTDVPVPDTDVEVPADANMLKASLPESGLKSRVSITINDNKGICTWDKKDAFKAFDQTGKSTVYTILPEKAGTQCAEFVTPNISFGPTLAVFPSWFASVLKEKGMSISFPSQYSESSPSHNTPMLGRVSGKDVQFIHLVGLLRINFANLPLGYNTIKVVTNRSITGTFKIEDLQSDSFQLVEDTSVNDHRSEVVVTHNGNTSPFYIPLPAGIYDEIHVFAVNGKKEYQLFDAADKEIRCGSLYNVDRDYLVHASDKDFQTLMERIRQENVTRPSEKSVEAVLSTFNSVTGKFSDINYTDSQGATWQALAHLDRLQLMASAYIDETNKKFFGDKGLFNQIVSGLSYWTKPGAYADSEGWWYNKIAQPKQLGMILIKMRAGKQRLSTDLEANVLRVMELKGGNPYEKTGANRTDIATHWIYRACLSGDREVLTVALNSAFSAVCYTTGEGFQHDGGFFQHGSQIYIGGYGDEILKSVIQIASLVHDTPFALGEDKIQLLSRFLRETYYKAIRGTSMSFSILGRSVSRPDAISKSKSYIHAQRMKELDPAHASEYEAIINRLVGGVPTSGVKASHNHLFRSDYTMHVRPHYTFDVRMSSKYTCRSEQGNGENLKGYFIADGSTNILVDGKEYLNIFPVWKWSQVPGVTAPELDNSSIPSNGAEWGVLGTSSFAGGVSDGLYGATAYAYDDHTIHTGAHKGWFFFDDEVVCTGTVHSDGTGLKTTVNQCYAGASQPVYSTGNSVAMLSGSTELQNPCWAFNDHIGYVFPQGGSIWMRNMSQSGSWNSINKKQKTGTLSEKVFSLGFNHDTSEHNSYAYIVVPGISSSNSLAAYCTHASPIDIIKLNENVQSVYHKTLKNWQTIFFKGSSYVTRGAMKIQVDQPCVVMVKEKDNQYQVSVADPSRRQSVVRITLTTSASQTQVITADFRGSNVYAGRTLDFSIQK